jgi:hypothetical protein
MAKTNINIGTTANDGTGDTLRAAGGKINDNFDEIYTALGDGSELNVPFSGSYDDLSDKPTIPADLSDLTDTTTLLFSGSYTDLSDQPTIPADLSDLTDTTNLLFDGEYSSLSGAPTIPADLSDLTDTTTLLFSGSYTDLTDQPTIPADTGDLTNNADFFANGDSVLTLAVSTTAPSSPVTGMIAIADGNTAGWDPAGTNLGVAYPVFYNGSAWTALL